MGPTSRLWRAMENVIKQNISDHIDDFKGVIEKVVTLLDKPVIQLRTNVGWMLCNHSRETGKPSSPLKIQMLCL